MKYVAIEDFIDLEDEQYLYHAGDTYPRQGLTVTKERTKELSSDSNKMGYPLIKAVKPKKKEE